MSNEGQYTACRDTRSRYESELIDEWVKLQLAELASSSHGLQERQIREESREFLDEPAGCAGRTRRPLYLLPGVQPRSGEPRSDLHGPTEPGFHTFGSGDVHLFSQAAAVHPTPHASFRRHRHVCGEQIWAATTLIDKLGLYITEIYQKGRNQVIARQQEEMLELSTPVVQLWEGVLALPLIGTLDSARTQVVMQNLLEAIVQTGAEIAIIDITGVPTVDTLVAQHLLKTVAAARLMGADCIISGIRPQIAQTIIHLGVDLTNVVDQGNAGRRIRHRVAALRDGGGPRSQTEQRRIQSRLADRGKNSHPKDG